MKKSGSLIPIGFTVVAVILKVGEKWCKIQCLYAVKHACAFGFPIHCVQSEGQLFETWSLHCVVFLGKKLIQGTVNIILWQLYWHPIRVEAVLLVGSFMLQKFSGMPAACVQLNYKLNLHLRVLSTSLVPQATHSTQPRLSAVSSAIS